MTTATATRLKLTVDRPSFAAALKSLGCVIAARTPKPVLLCVKLTAADGVLRIAGTNLELFARRDVGQVQIDGDGEACVSHEKLTAIVGGSADGTITLEMTDDGSRLIVRDSSATYKLPTYPAEEFPPTPIAEGVAFDTEPGAFNNAMAKVDFACSTETSRYAINGVLLDGGAKAVKAVATDGRRLAMATLSGVRCADLPTNTIIPTGAIQAIANVIGDDAMTITVGGGNISFKSDSALVVSNLIEGAFPPYKDVVPKDHAIHTTLAAEALLGLLRGASIMVSEESKGVRFKFAADKLTLSTRTPEVGESDMSMPITLTGDAIEIGFNPRFVAEAIKASGAIDVALSLTSDKKPLTIKAGDWLAVVMPVSLG